MSSSIPGSTTLAINHHADNNSLPSDRAAAASQHADYSPPHLSDSPGVGYLRTKNYPLTDDGNVKINRELTWDVYARPPELKSNALVIETGDRHDRVHVSNTHNGRLNVKVNGKSYSVDEETIKGLRQKLHIKTNGGDDRVTINNDVKSRVIVEAGEGNDYVEAGAGKTRLFGGRGNDTLRLGDGTGYAEGNDGDDTIIGGHGNNVMYGNNGNDRLYAGAGASDKETYLDGGDGSDRLYAGNGHSILNGGKGNDQLIGHDRTTFYTGKGRDQIYNNARGDLLYAKADDTYDRSKGSSVTEVTPSKAGNIGFKVEGSPEFLQRVDDDLELLRSSPSGQKMLGDMDTAAKKAGGPVTITEGNLEGNNYLFKSSELNKAMRNNTEPKYRDHQMRGVITGNKPGSLADKGELTYERAFIGEPSDKHFDPPIIGFVHEAGHAWNGLTGTNEPGKTIAYPAHGPGPGIFINNREFQVVGIPNSAPLFDFDNNPSTPPTNTNPEHHTENGMNKEMGRKERKSYIY